MTSQLVLPSGPLDAKVVIVGEAPGADEVRLKRPFAGKSGQLLNHALSKGRIVRGDCYVTNVIKVRPEGNRISHFIKFNSKGVPTLTTEAQIYLDNFKLEYDRLNPNVTLAVGNVALWALTGQTGIYKWRGSILQGHRGEKVIPIIHPAAALRNYNLRYPIYYDLIRAGEESAFPEIKRHPRNLIIKPTVSECLGYIEACRREKFACFDIENRMFEGGREMTCISFSYHKDHAICIPFLKGQADYFSQEQEIRIRKAITSLLEDEEVVKVAHNATFDSTFFYRMDGTQVKNFHCTMIMMGLIYSDLPADLKPKSLRFATSIHTDVPYYKEDRKADGVSGANESFWIYSARDSVVLPEIYEDLKGTLKELGSWDTYVSQKALIPPLIYMNAVGLNVNEKLRRSTSADIEQEADFILEQIKAIVGDDYKDSFKFNSTYFYKTLKHKPYKSKDGRTTCDEKALKRLANSYPEAALILKRRGLIKLNSTYLKAGLKNGRLRSSMNPIGTWTLRLSSSRDIDKDGANIQTLPPLMKRNIIPDEGYIGVEQDLSQAENRVVAYIAPEPILIGQFERKKDIHSEAAVYVADAFGYKLTSAEIKELDKLHKIHPDNPEYTAPIGQGKKTWRYWGKESNHALNYGLHWKSAALRWEIKETQARRIYETKHAIHSGISRGMWQWIEKELQETMTLSNLFGFRRQFLGPRGPWGGWSERAAWDKIKKKAYAFPAQSTVAEIINRWGVKYLYYRQDLFHDVILLNQVHDSVWYQVPFNKENPTTKEFERLCEVISLVRDNLQQTLSFRGQNFVIPADTTLYLDNFADGVDVDTYTPERLEELLCPTPVRS